MVQGVVARINKKPWENKVLHSITLNGDNTMYSTGENVPDAVPGQTIEFDTKVVGKYTYVTGDIRHLTDGSVAVAPPVSNNRFGGARKPFVKDEAKEKYWADREARDVKVQATIQRQACRNSAISFVELATKLGVLPVAVPADAKKAAVTKALGVLEEYVDHYTNKFIADNLGVPEMADDDEPAMVTEETTTPANIWNT